MLRKNDKFTMEPETPGGWKNSETKRKLDEIVRSEIWERNRWREQSEQLVQDFLGPLKHDYCLDPSTVEFFGQTLKRIKDLEAKINRIAESGVGDEDLRETQQRVAAARQIFDGKSEDARQFVSWLEADLQRQRTQGIPAAVAALDREIETNIHLKEELQKLKASRA